MFCPVDCRCVFTLARLRPSFPTGNMVTVYVGHLIQNLLSNQSTYNLLLHSQEHEMMCSYKTAKRRFRLLSFLGLPSFSLQNICNLYNLLCEIQAVTRSAYLDNPHPLSLWGPSQSRLSEGQWLRKQGLRMWATPSLFPGGRACRAVLLSSESWEPGRNVSLDCT